MEKKTNHGKRRIMILFLLSFLSVYGSIHLYLFVKARAALAPGLGFSLIMAFFLAAMVVTPIAVRLLERHGFHMTARFLAYIGYTWMGLIFLFFWAALCLDIVNLCLWLLAFLPSSGTGRLLWTGRVAFEVLSLGVVLLGIWSAFSAWQIRLDRVFLQTAKLPMQLERLNIVQISDIHLGMMVGRRRLERILALVQRAEPDLLVCTGDLVDAQMDRFDRLADMLAQIRPPLGKFAVLGNHEFYAGVTQSENFLQAAGFKVLRNQRYLLENLLTVVGVDDPLGRRYQGNWDADQGEVALLTDLDSKKLTLLLKHRPLVELESLGRFDLQLSGHTHGGQIFPFTLITQLFYTNQSGLASLEKDSLLYVSRGAGTWGPPMRLLAPPHVTLIELSRKEK
jgi:predicted MPP superfamily phosphohydrolase